jgi:hypothetical protein
VPHTLLIEKLFHGVSFSRRKQTGFRKLFAADTA